MVSMAAHCIRLAQGKAKHRSLSDYTLFVDIASAYYTLLRQHCVDLSWHDEDIICLLRRLGIEDTHIESVAEMLSSAPAFSQLGVPGPLHALVAEFHSATWFTLAGDWRLTSTHRGTRPGDGFADVLWSAAFSQFLHSVETKIRAANHTCPLQWNQERGLYTAEGDTQVHGACVTWADDIACFGQTSTADDLVPALQTTSSILFSALTALGLKPNMGRGKTEVIATPRGRNKTPVRQFIHHALHSSIPIPEQGDQEVALRVVAHYPHLGGQISHCGRMRGELRRRLAIASQSMKDLSTKVYNNPKVDLSTRLAIFRATTWPALTYNAGTWLPLTGTECKLWHSGVMRLYRQTLKKLFPFHELCHLSDMEVLDLTELPHPETALRLCRLRYFGQTLDRGNPTFWALVAAEQTWLQQVRADFDWMYWRGSNGMHTFRSFFDKMWCVFMHGFSANYKTWAFRGWLPATMAWDIAGTLFFAAYHVSANAPGAAIALRCMDASMPAALSLMGSLALHVANSTHHMND